MGVIAKQSIRGTIVTYLGVAVGFVTTFFVITRFLTSEEIGLARVMIDAATLFIGLAQLGTANSSFRFFPYFKDGARNHGFFFWTIVVPLLGFALFALVYWACHAPLAQWFGAKSPLFVNYYYFILPMSFFMLYQTVFETNAVVLMHIVMPRFVREVVVRIGLLACYLLYAFRVLSMDGFVMCLCVVYAIAAIVNLCYLISLDRISLKPDWEFIKANGKLVRSYILYTGFLIIAAVTSVLAPTLSSFFITAQMGLSYTGIYAIATYIAVMISIPSRSVIAVSQTELATAIKNNDSESLTSLVRKIGVCLMLIGGFILLVIWMNIDLIFTILPNGATYAVAKKTILLLGLGQWMVAIFSVFMPALSYSRYYAFSLLTSLVLTGSSLLLNNYLIPVLGMDGAAWATMLSDVIYYILIVIFYVLAIRANPFTVKHLLVGVMVAALFGLNYLWQTYLPIPNIWFDAIVRNIVLLGLGVLFAYRLNISPEINALLRSLFISRH